MVALVRQLRFELRHRVEVIGDRVLVSPDNHEHIFDSRSSRFFHHVLNGGLVDNGQHLLRHCLGRWQEAGTEAGRRNHSFESRGHALQRTYIERRVSGPRTIGYMADRIDDEKRALRAELRERRQSLSEIQRAEASDALTERLLALVDSLGARSVSCYLNTMNEPSTRGFLNEAIARGIRILLPVTRADGLLDWSVADADGTEIPGLFGIPEPEGELLGPIAVGDVDLMIIPAAAVDQSGMRLGWGRGYFDKTIGSMQKCPPVFAVIYDAEFVEELPRDVHDQPVTGIVTPERIYRFSPES